MTSETRAEKLAILVWAADPGRPELCATPFYFAAAAAAMDAEVEMYFTARSVELLRKGIAEAIEAAAGSGRSVADFRRDALALGVRLYACPAAMVSHGIADAELIPEVAGQAGAAAYLGRALDTAWRTLGF
ncbi:DsrE/DsrF/DrsH-like family protein [Thauera sinica]|uniref:DsrE/DsrF/DrsH-like family protein n=1 Tax=Thauera sinica TaxID=2665146 RepID=A0ABW1ANU9_9RHOO|nr:DsrE/DsrF/DrsH-like family protein [Thauera sp. K11]ATE62017.1 peroxiredoxin [Thauera sp. K11]